MNRYFLIYVFLFLLSISLSAQYVAVGFVNGNNHAGRVWSFKSESGQDLKAWCMLQDEGYCPDGTTVDSYTSIIKVIIKRNIQLWKQPDLSMICMHDSFTFQEAGNVPVNFIKNI